MAVAEEALVARSRDGDRDAFEELVRRYERGIYNLAYRMMGNRDDAADLAQEAFVKAFESLHGFRGRASFQTWLYRIATNACLDELRRRRRFRTRSLDRGFETDEGEVVVEPGDPSPGPEERVQKREIQRAVHRAIGTLSPDHRAVVVLRDIKGLSYGEIAASLRISVGTVKSRLNRARSALKERFLKEELLTRAGVVTGEEAGER